MIDYKTLDLTEDDLKEMYRLMLTTRKIDERMMLLNRAGKIPFVVSCQGKEAAQVGAAYALKKKVDYLNPYYRDLGMVTTLGTTPLESMLAAFAKRDDTSSGGRQMPGHFSDYELNIVTQGSTVTTQVLHAAGIAYALKMDGKEAVSFTSLGEGSTSQGDFHEALNFASVHQLPYICFIENNGYAISVPKSLQYNIDDLSERKHAYGIHGEQINGNDPLEVYQSVKTARTRAINGEGPTIIDALVSRIGAHSSDDDDSYRDKAHVQTLKETDCLLTFKDYILKNTTIEEEWFDVINEEVKNIINDATKEAEHAPYAEPSYALKHVYEEEV